MRGIVGSAALRAALATSVLVASFAYGGHCNGADLLPPIWAEQSEPNPRPNSFLVFAGRISTTDLGNTALFNLTQTGGGPNYDNYIVGVAYDRDLFHLGHGFYFGVEVGLADRLGNYKECCSPPVMSNSIVQSAELWTGPQIRYDGFLLFDQLRIGGGVTAGLSAATASIGHELYNEIATSGDARLLFYFGPELDFSTPSIPNLEFVLKIQHRSGADGTLGRMGEGSNANVAGIRYRF